MSRYTKRELEEQLDILRHENRRYKRALNMIDIDIDIQKDVNINIERKVPPNEHVQTVLANAEREWKLNVTEPGEGGDSSRISYYINSRNCLGWSNIDYQKNGDFAWCGAFAAAVYGPQVLFNIRFKIFSSCYRLYDNWSKTSRHQDKEEIRPGDLVIVFTSDDRKPFWGNHITIARTSPDKDGNFHTTEGNAHGVNPDQQWVEGVVKRTRNIKDVAHVYRLIDEDYEQ
jgi:hypothetical protein